MLEILQLPILQDNYIYLIHDSESGETAAVDPGLAQPVLDVLSQKNWQLNYIFNTHHHWDHIDGNLELKHKTGCKIIAGQGDSHRIPGIDSGVNDGDTLSLGKHPISIMATPGHTLHHIVYYFPEEQRLFCGDTLFVMGCGRLFEGSAEQMWQSLQKLKALPPATQIYCTHEYTQNNGKFALTVEPDNMPLQQKMRAVNQLRTNNQPTVPSTIEEELATNPFFRENSRSLQTIIGMINKPPVQVFAEIRRLKDNF
ncbi:Hydroxyacylglutathione hydrolase [Crenothrix polyspora]|jgi:hydroxyacylglutathione hydrolase|uniref:Hydroxyacylglutathione hydrolase n=1 Tax=Crenothrix polyspora TaxID=360316 RepID=A0A1R4GZI6_9GAMM|nr:hydroxyacylglutathione hydrolase [Crenothrix polyspora]SJM89418.1 Hydroxyacylglutathione hydrolase [Crenothrix polyspora]